MTHPLPQVVLTALRMTNATDTLDEVNRRGYASAKVVDWYNELDFIHPAEATILERLLPAIKDQKLLDLGIGGGRTTKFLLEISSDYTGIDYTPASLEVARRKYPEANLLCCDARDLSVFPNDSFRFALFSLNGIDYVVHEGRLMMLREILRVLQPGGFFMFSTHNRDYRNFDKLPWQEGLQFNLNWLKSCLYTLAFLRKHSRMQRHEVHTDEYAIINDNAHGFSLLSYYIGIEQQKAQLEGAGFVDVEAFDMEGKRVESDQDSPWIHYLAQKPRDAS
jgi:ubiquinone/menaquinone biosynthesis C-methylase UbiE